MVGYRLSLGERLRLGAAIGAVRAGMKLRAAASTFRVAKTTLHRYATARGPPKRPQSLPTPSAGRPTAFTAKEERLIVNLICRYADRGIPLTRTDVVDAFAIFISRLPVRRQCSLPFRTGRPGVKFIRNFSKRNRKWLRFAKPVRQEGKRFAAMNAEALTTHFAALEKLVADLGVDHRRVWNLDETGATPGKDVSGASSRRRYLSRSCARDMRVPDFANIHRITMMPVVSAAGDVGPTLFAFKGTSLPYRSVVRGGNVAAETYADYLPRGAVISMRDDRGGVNSQNFFEWAKHFVNHIRDLTVGGRKVILLYDAYRSHLSLRVLQYFEKNNVEVYTLPAHTSGKTQPCDVVLFSAFKNKLNENILAACRLGAIDRFDTFDFCAMMRDAFYASFTRDNIKASFRRAGVWPVDASRLLSAPRPRTASDISDTLSVDALEVLLEEKRHALRTAILGADAKFAACGFLDTSSGLVLTSARAMALAKEKAEQDAKKRSAKEVDDLRKSLAASRRLASERADARKRRDASWRNRAQLANMTEAALRASVRPMLQRRAEAKLRTKLRRNGN